MASIALCVGDTGHASTSNAVSMLTAMGHTVTTYNESSVTEVQLNAADLICWLRSTASTVTTGLTNIKTAFNNGKPIVFAAKGGQTDGAIEPDIKQGFFLNFCTEQGIKTNAVDVIEIGVSQYTLQTSATFWYFIEQQNLADSANVIATANDTSGSLTRVIFAYCLAGSLDRIGGRFPANIAFCGALYSANNTHTEQTKNLLSRAINEVLTTGFNVPVSVTGLTTLPAKVVVFKSDLSYQTDFITDNAGGYSELFLRGGKYTAVCLSTENTKNSIVIDFEV